MNVAFILDSLFSAIKKAEIVCVVHYGNTTGGDIDLFVVIKNEAPYNTFRLGLLDITAICQQALPVMLRHCDPLVTEPILTGTVIYGSHPLINRECINKVCDDFTPNYLMQYARLFYGWACLLVMENRMYEGVQTLGFAYSYVLYAVHYYKGGSLVTFSEIRRKDGSPIFQVVRKAKHVELSHVEIFTIFKCTNSYLTDFEKVLTF